MHLLNKSILTLLSLMVLLHSVSVYAAPERLVEESPDSIEMTQDEDGQDLQLKAYDALIPSVQGMTPLVWFFIHEVVLITEAEFHELPEPVKPENRFLKILFPLIIGPNAP